MRTYALSVITVHNMVIEETQTTLTPEIVTVQDLLGGGSSGAAASAADAVPVSSGSPNVDKLEQWIRILDKGLSIADRGITIIGKADSIVRNISEVLMKQQQQQQQQTAQQVYLMPAEEFKNIRAVPAGSTDAGQGQVQPADNDHACSCSSCGSCSSTDAEPGPQLITAERISSVLSMLLSQCPPMTVKELKELIDRNPDTINTMLKFIK